MVVAYHLVFGCYGFWLPNDPCGSWSKYVGGRRLYEVGGPATTVGGRRSFARDPHDHGARLDAKATLRHPPVQLDGRQALGVVRGFAHAVAEAVYECLACAVMPDHAHLVVGRHPKDAQLIIAHLKARATRRLNLDGTNPRPDAGPWGRRGWVVFLNDEDDVRRAVRYVEQNPVRAGLRRQVWSFVGKHPNPRDKSRG